MRMKTWTKNNQNGFTAMELLIAILVFLIVAAVSTPFMLGAIQDYRLRGAAWQVVGDLRLARQKSVASGRKYRLWFHHNGAASDRNSYKIQRLLGVDWTAGPTEDDPSHPIYLQQPGSPTYVMIDSTTSTPADGKIYFSATGTVSNYGTMILVDSRGKRYHVIINSVGRVRVVKQF